MVVMKILVRAVITGFGLSVGAALYKKIAKQLGLDDKAGTGDGDRTSPAATGDGSPLSRSEPSPTAH